MTLSKDLNSLGDVLYQTFITFPHSAYTIPRQRDLAKAKTGDPAAMLASTERSGQGQDPDKGLSPEPATTTFSDDVYRMCTSSESVSSLLAANPDMSPGDAWRSLYGRRHLGGGTACKPPSSLGSGVLGAVVTGAPPLDRLERAAKCGNWGPQKPSDFFLKIYHDALETLDGHPHRAMVSPSLMGSCGVVPLTVISTIPDIVRHMSNLIVRAQREVFLATNFWQNGEAAKFLTNAIKELSRRAGERDTRIVFKITYDRGSAKQLIEPHYLVPEKDYAGKAVGLPRSDEIPNIDLQVMNYHNPLMGTFHAKYMIVDRKVAVIQSNNIQDNDNLEMMMHMEGPIVDSMYDMALLSWHKNLVPPMPCCSSPAVTEAVGCFYDHHDGIFGPGGTIKGHHAAVDSDQMAERQAYGGPRDEGLRPGGAVSGYEQSTDHSSGPADPVISSGGRVDEKEGGQEKGVGQETPTSPTGPSSHAPQGPDDTTNELLSHGEQDRSQSGVPLPLRTEASPLPEHTTADPHYDVSISAEVSRVQASVSPSPGVARMEAITRHLNHTTNQDFGPGERAAPECDAADEMTPYIPHRSHEPFPMAMVCRAPHGPPNHHSVSNPQNASWLAALRYAASNVFIQSPTLNAEPLLPAIIDACERGVDVFCYICLGYNDIGELLPMQGGHNEMVAHRLYAALSPQGRTHLHYHWYVAKDSTVPYVQDKRRRSCHIKLLIADERVAIMGNGNQDTQSWFHSQEVNVMLDSPAVCRAWIDALRRNQNTHLYGALDRADGVWRDTEGKEAEGAIGVDPGRFSWSKGVVGALKRLQGTGGF